VGELEHPAQRHEQSKGQIGVELKTNVIRRQEEKEEGTGKFAREFGGQKAGRGNSIFRWHQLSGHEPMKSLKSWKEMVKKGSGAQSCPYRKFSELLAGILRKLNLHGTCLSAFGKIKRLVEGDYKKITRAKLPLLKSGSHGMAKKGEER